MMTIHSPIALESVHVTYSVCLMRTRYRRSTPSLTLPATRRSFGCGESFRSDAFVRLIKEWTEYSSHHAPIRDIKDKGMSLEIVEIAEEILSPHQRPLTGLLYEGWFTNLVVPILNDEKAPPATCICTLHPRPTVAI